MPEMFDDFFAHKSGITAYPARKNLLHEMRKAGKPLRYAMELGEYCFGDEFKNCLEEVKEVLELMGEIHDADVMMPEVNMHIGEMRQFNASIAESAGRISTKMLREIVVNLRDSRQSMYAELTEKLNRWQSEDFKSRIIGVMSNYDNRASTLRQLADKVLSPT